MIPRLVLLLLAAMLAGNATADDLDELCAAGGYYSGAQDRFMSGVATHILQKRGVLGTSLCSSQWQIAFQVGERFSKTGQSNPEDSPVLRHVTAFSTKVYSSVANGTGY